ncbi:MAG TPA: PTS system mannose/fructose/sorbose family transporter subunit IID [Candidatus Krumholzibacteria bacterium]|nr:PTS system mannose/fructose/sorbose family transporter subunit IID [Candidatus Krumholzibacteria bacterium]
MSGRPVEPRQPALSTGLRLAMALRSLALQASWNPRRMQHMGLLSVMMPWARDRRLDRRELRRLCRDHFGYFNTNPYLANYVVGGVLRLEEDARRSGGGYERTVRSFKETVGRALASLGDQLFWLGLQPALLMLGVLLGLGAPAWAVLMPVGAFSFWQLVLRYRSLGDGYRLGMDIADLLGAPFWHQAIHVLKRVGAVLTGVFAAWMVAAAADLARRPDGPEAVLGLVLATGLALWLRRRAPGEAVLLLLLPLALVLTYL